MRRVIDNPPSRYQASATVYEFDPPTAELRVYEDDTQEILSRNDSPDLGFRWSVNPYRGCFHGCAYCYARPSHEYLGFGAGTDFERRLLAKPRAPELLEEAFRSRSWEGELVMFSGNTDCYQPLEIQLELVRRCLHVCLRYRNPVAVITKSALVERDVELLAALHREASAAVVLSIPFLDPAACRAIEPGAPPPRRRLQAVERLASAGVPVGVNLAPVIPGLNDKDIPAILRAARAAGASFASIIPLRLHPTVQPVFEERLRTAMPGRADAILAKTRRTRDGELHESRFTHRFAGSGPEWEATRSLFHLWSKRLGFGDRPAAARGTFRAPGGGRQLSLLAP
jgi:DNA repair photolyase